MNHKIQATRRKCNDSRNDAGFYPREAYGIPQNPPNQTILILKALTWDPPFQEPPIFSSFQVLSSIESVLHLLPSLEMKDELPSHKSRCCGDVGEPEVQDVINACDILRSVEKLLSQFILV
jgi:hypothetical protein